MKVHAVKTHAVKTHAVKTLRRFAFGGRAAATAMALLFLSLVACKDEGGAATDGALVSRGKAVYAATCIACHNLDPTQDGALGPALAGASLELLRAKVLENKYPPGYKPKRATGQMVAMPQAKDDLAAIAAFLGSLR